MKYILIMFLLPVMGAFGQSKPADFKPSDFIGPVLLPSTDNIYIVEAENLTHTAKWQLRTDAGTAEGAGCNYEPDFPNREGWEKHTGTGYLRWEGGSQGVGHDEDEHQEYQGDHADWLVIKLWVNEPGQYWVNVRSYHVKRDGDNDIWIGAIGQTSKVYRQANCKTNMYSYGTWGKGVGVEMEKGFNAVYVAGRSHLFGIDRIAIYKAEEMDKALAPNAPISKAKTVALETEK